MPSFAGISKKLTLFGEKFDRIGLLKLFPPFRAFILYNPLSGSVRAADRPPVSSSQKQPGWAVRDAAAQLVSILKQGESHFCPDIGFCNRVMGSPMVIRRRYQKFIVEVGFESRNSGRVKLA